MLVCFFQLLNNKIKHTMKTLIHTHNNETYPISTELYQGILAISTIANGYIFTRRYQFHSETEALKDFKRQLSNELNK